MRRLLFNWPYKLAALAIAFLIWFFVSTDETTIAQRGLLVPLTIEGIAENQVVVGVPEFVEITISGPDTRVNALRPESFDALLNLREANGEFERPVTVNIQQGLTLVRVNPSEVIGIIETVTVRSIPVQVALLGEPPENVTFDVVIEPESVNVRGQTAPLAEVAFATAPVPPQEGTHQVNLYPSNASGLPVRDVTLEPNAVTVHVTTETTLSTRTLPVILELPDVSPYDLESVTLHQDSVTVAGPRDQVETLERVPTTVTLPDGPLEADRYTLYATPQLPDDVATLEPLLVTLQLADPEPEPDGEAEAEPDTDAAEGSPEDAEPESNLNPDR
jgi:YbbR domain-containing protein